LSCKELGIVEIRFRQRRYSCGFFEACFGLVRFSQVCVGFRQQSHGTVGIVLGIARGGEFDIGQGRLVIPEVNCGDTPAIVRIVGDATRCDRAIVKLPSVFVVPLVKIQVREFFQVSRRRILRDHGFQVPDAFSPRECLKRISKKPKIRNDFYDDINQRPDRSKNQNYPQPIPIRTPPDEVDDRHRVENQTPGVKGVNQAH
jgi:hypothetical protein